MKVCIFGNKTSTKRLIENLNSENINIDHLVVLNSVSAEKIEISGKSHELVEVTKKYRIKVYFAESYSLSKKKDLDFFEYQKFDLGLCTGWQRLIPLKILKTFKYGIFGWHGSGFEFPNGRGRSPLNWSIRLGLKQIYHNCFLYSEGIDEGKIFDTKIIKIKKNDYIHDLQEKAFNHIAESSLNLVKQIKKGNIKLTEQIDYPYVKFPKLNEKSGQIYPEKMSTHTALQIIRSCSRPFPGAFVILNKKKFRIWKASKKNPNELIGHNEKFKLFKEELIIKFKDSYIISNDFDITN